MHTHLPLTAEGRIVWNVRRVERFVVFEEVNKDPVDLVSGVDGGLDLALAALDGVEKGVAKVSAVEGELIAQEIESVAEEGIALLGHCAVDDHISADVDGGIHPGLGPDLIGKEEIVDAADSGEITGDEIGTGARNRHEMTSTSSGNQQFQVIDAFLLLRSEKLIVLELPLEDSGKGRSDVCGWEQGTLDDGENLVGGLGAAAIAVGMEQVDDTFLPKFEDVVRIGAESDERLDHLPFERTSGQRFGYRQVGVGAGEAASVEQSTGDELVESTHDAIGDAPLLGLDGADGADFLAHEQVGGSGKASRKTETAHQQVTDGAQVDLVGLVERERGLSAVEFDLVGVDKVVEKAGCGAACQMIGVALYQISRPAFVVDAGRFVTENDELGLMSGYQGVESGDVALVAVLESGNLDGLVEQETFAGVEGGPIDVLADVQRSDEYSVVGNASCELPEGLSPATLNVEQLLLFAGTLTHDTTSFVSDLGYSLPHVTNLVIPGDGNGNRSSQCR